MGTGHGYHALTFGTLVGKLVHNITGMTLGEYFDQLITKPLGVDAWIGLPKDKFKNLAPLITDGKRTATAAEPNTDAYWLSRAMTFGGALDHRIESFETGFNNPKLLEAELPGAGGVSNAYSLAKIYSAAATVTDGIRLLEDGTLRAATATQSTGPLRFESQTGPFPVWGNGFMLDAPGFKVMLSPSSFGHDGLGGQIAFGDLKHRIGFAYSTNYLIDLEAGIIVDVEATPAHRSLEPTGTFVAATAGSGTTGCQDAGEVRGAGLSGRRHFTSRQLRHEA